MVEKWRSLAGKEVPSWCDSKQQTWDEAHDAGWLAHEGSQIDSSQTLHERSHGGRHLGMPKNAKTKRGKNYKGKKRKQETGCSKEGTGRPYDRVARFRVCEERPSNTT